MKIINNSDFEEIYRWVCPTPSCGFANEDSESPTDGETLECASCGRTVKYKDE